MAHLSLKQHPNLPLSDRAPGPSLSGWWKRKRRKVHHFKGVQVSGLLPRCLKGIQTKTQRKKQHHPSKETPGKGFPPGPFKRRWRDWLKQHRGQRRFALRTCPRGLCLSWRKCPGRGACLSSSRNSALPADRILKTTKVDCQSGSAGLWTRRTKLDHHTAPRIWDMWTSPVRKLFLRRKWKKAAKNRALGKFDPPVHGRVLNTGKAKKKTDWLLLWAFIFYCMCALKEKAETIVCKLLYCHWKILWSKSGPSKFLFFKNVSSCVTYAMHFKPVKVIMILLYDIIEHLCCPNHVN